jgi:nucleoside phosphorylase
MALVQIFAASEAEAEPVRRIAHATVSGASAEALPLRVGGNDFLVIVGGMGPRAARAKAVEALTLSPLSDGVPLANQRKPDAVLVIGLCGGLSRSLSETQIVAYTDCLSTEQNKPPVRCSPSVTNSLIELLKSRGIACSAVTGITSPRVAVTKEERLALGQSGASAVDMESYEILAVANQAAIPGAALRVVSDSLDREMPDFNRALRTDGTVDRWQLFRAMLGSPLRTARLLALNKRAMQHFAKALEVILPADCFARATPFMGE